VKVLRRLMKRNDIIVSATPLILLGHIHDATSPGCLRIQPEQNAPGATRYHGRVKFCVASAQV